MRYFAAKNAAVSKIGCSKTLPAKISVQTHLKKFTIFGILAPRFALWAKVKFEFIKFDR